MTTSTYMAALAALDEAPREEVSQVFISPLGDQSTEVDAETETAAFVSRPDPMRESETKPISIEVNGGRNERSAFAEAAGLYCRRTGLATTSPALSINTYWRGEL